MNATRTSNYHVEYLEDVQHWHPASQPYAGGDNLVGALYEGWEMSNVVAREEHWFAGMRFVAVYHVELNRDGETLIMPVIFTPYITRLLAERECSVITLDEFKRAREKSTQD
jgi:hypothetical protein